MLVLGVQHNDLVFIIHRKMITVSLVTACHHSDKNFLPCHENFFFYENLKTFFFFKFMYLATLGLSRIMWDLVS